MRKENVNVEVDLEIGKIRLTNSLCEGDIGKHKFKITVGVTGDKIYLEFDDAKNKDKEWVHVGFEIKSMVRESYKLLLEKGYIKE